MDNKIINEELVTKVEHFGIQRKIVAHMTTRSWQEIPHFSTIYEPDVTEFFDMFKTLKKKREDDGKSKVTFNTIMLKAIAEGLKAAPSLNSTLEFDHKKVTGTLTQREDIDFSIPWTLPTGEMMTITLPDVQDNDLDEITEKLDKIANKVKNTNCTEAMYEISFDETINQIKKGNIGVFGRIIAAKIGKHRVHLLKGQAKKDYYNIPEDDRLTLKDLRQGTITVSNLGSIHKSFTGYLSLLEIIPPQVFAIGICSTQTKPISVLQKDGTYKVESKLICPMCLAGDHRALDYGDLVPFIDRLDDIFAHPEQIMNW